jgi:hypothetical protein
MSELKVNKISPRSGTDITLGNSGTDFIVPSGATITVNSGGQIVNNGTTTGFGLVWQVVQTTGFTAAVGNAYPCNTTSAGFTITLPATPSAGDQVQVVDYAGTFDTNALTIAGNGEDIEGLTDNVLLTGEREGVTLTYIDATQGWIATSGINEGTDALEPVTVNVEYLVIAGGGAGGSEDDRAGGGGGAGGYRSSVTGESSGGGASAETALTLSAATNYTVTVGAGGAGTSVNTRGNSGSNSVFSTITSIGGGGGAVTDGTRDGLSGGSGGGACRAGAVGTGTANQGYNGGAGFEVGSTSDAGGGGGGASAVGGNASSGTGGTGGAGVSSSITGSSTGRAGGGGGAVGTGSGGSATEGGGAGGNATNSGTVNTGGGGGARAGVAGTSGSGGSGVVILKYPSTFTISNPGGGLTSSTATAGGFSVTSFTAGTGNVQFN